MESTLLFFHNFWLFLGYEITLFKERKIMKHKKFIQTDIPVTNKSTQANWHGHCAAHHHSNDLFLFCNLLK